MALPAFKNGRPLFKNGLPAFGGAACACCGGCATTLGGCTNCGGSVSTYVEMVFAGIVTACVTAAGLTRTDLSGATVSGTFTVTLTTNCLWQLIQNPGTSFNERVINSISPTGAGACSGTVLFQNYPLEFRVGIVDRSGTKYVTASLFGSNAIYFYGEAMLTDCLTATYVLSNDTSISGFVGARNGVGGTCTITFCPS